MTIAIKRKIRQFSLWLGNITDAWVVSKKIRYHVDQKQFKLARLALRLAENSWPQDPEITRVRMLISFLEGNE